MHIFLYNYQIDIKHNEALNRNIVTTLTLLLILATDSVSARNIYRWVDQQGQVHFSDNVPQRVFTAEEIRESEVSAISGNGLRPAETELLLQIQRRAQQQQQLAQARRLKAGRERAEQNKSCKNSRKALQASRGHDSYKQHSMYLRNHCW